MKIHYKKLSPREADELLLIGGLENSESGKTVITCDTRADRIIINGKAYTLTGGEAHISDSDIEDGTVKLSFIRGSKEIPAEPFNKCGARIERCAPTREEHNNVLKLLMLALDSIEELTEGQKLIKQKLEPPKLFKFN